MSNIFGSPEADIIMKQAAESHGDTNEYRWIPTFMLNKRSVLSFGADGWKVALVPPLALPCEDIYILFTRKPSETGK